VSVSYDRGTLIRGFIAGSLIMRYKSGTAIKLVRRASGIKQQQQQQQ